MKGTVGEYLKVKAGEKYLCVTGGPYATAGVTYTVSVDGRINGHALERFNMSTFTKVEQDNSDLFSIEKPFGLLDAETQKRLKAWDGGIEIFNSSGGWNKTSPGWIMFMVYRAVPKKTIQYIDRPCHIGYDGEITICSGMEGNAKIQGMVVNGEPVGSWIINMEKGQ